MDILIRDSGRKKNKKNPLMDRGIIFFKSQNKLIKCTKTAATNLIIHTYMQFINCCCFLFVSLFSENRRLASIKQFSIPPFTKLSYV